MAAAPDGSPNTRTDVGVNEQVEMTSSAAATWTATAGTLAPATGTTVTWTAPAVAASPATITATPTAAGGTACSVAMNVVAPAERSQVLQTARTYTAGLAGSGFVAAVTIMPNNVSFTRIEVREESVAGQATGYYDTVLHWNGIMHPLGSWLLPDASNSGLIDTVGTKPPGAPGPFSDGEFIWPIPQSYRLAGSGAATGTVYSTGHHVQLMIGTSGREGTSKEGAVNTRAP